MFFSKIFPGHIQSVSNFPWVSSSSQTSLSLISGSQREEKWKMKGDVKGCWPFNSPESLFSWRERVLQQCEEGQQQLPAYWSVPVLLKLAVRAQIPTIWRTGVFCTPWLLHTVPEIGGWLPAVWLGVEDGDGSLLLCWELKWTTSSCNLPSKPGSYKPSTDSSIQNGYWIRWFLPLPLWSRWEAVSHRQVLPTLPSSQNALLKIVLLLKTLINGSPTEMRDMFPLTVWYFCV